MINSLYLCLNPDKPEAKTVEKKLHKAAKKQSIEIVDSPKDADCIITIGGDGTFLFGSRLALEHNCSLAGINLGRFGFLPSFDAENYDSLFDILKNSQPSIRSVLDVESSIGKFHAINEMVIERTSVERAARVTMISSPPIYGTLQNEIKIKYTTERKDFLINEMNHVIKEYSSYTDGKNDKEIGATFVCDGVIVATPLGSTGYSSSAGGPAISPYANLMSVTFCALHHPRIPPIVLTNNENIYIQVEEESALVTDGKHIGNIGAGEVIRVSVGGKGIAVFDKVSSVLSRLSHAFGVDRIT